MRSTPPFLLPLVYWVLLFNVVGSFTWGYGLLTFTCLLLAVLLLAALQRGAPPVFADRWPAPAGTSPEVTARLRLATRVLLGIVAISAIVGIAFPDERLIDIGRNTFLGCGLVAKGLNPYTHFAQCWYRVDATLPHVTVAQGQVRMFGVPYDYGFPYFPAFLYAYLPFVLLVRTTDAIRLANVVLVVANLAGIHLLVPSLASRDETPDALGRTRMVAVIAYLGIGVYTIEVIWHGIVDVWISTVLLYAFVFLARRRYVLGGVLLGLAQASKLLPAPIALVAVLLFLAGRPGFWKVLLAWLGTSLAFIVPYLLWSPGPFVSATILYYLTKHAGGDDTSVWFFLPRILQTPFLVAGVAATAAAVVAFVRREGATLADVLAGAFAGYLVFIAFSKMSHLNYLWEIYPLGCVALAVLARRLAPAPTAGSIERT